MTDSVTITIKCQLSALVCINFHLAQEFSQTDLTNSLDGFLSIITVHYEFIGKLHVSEFSIQQLIILGSIRINHVR